MLTTKLTSSNVGWMCQNVHEFFNVTHVAHVALIIRCYDGHCHKVKSMRRTILLTLDTEINYRNLVDMPMHQGCSIALIFVTLNCFTTEPLVSICMVLLQWKSLINFNKRGPWKLRNFTCAMLDRTVLDYKQLVLKSSWIKC